MAANFPNSPATGDSYTLAGVVYVYDGSAWKAAIGVGNVLAIQVFTSSGTYTPTTGMEYCMIECVGSGAGGGGVAQSTGAAQGGGGGGGGYSRKLATAAQVGASQTVTIANGGTGGSAGNNAGNAPASDTSVGTLCIGKSPTAGGGGAAANSSGVGGAAGVSGTGDFTVPGEPGRHGTFTSLTTITPNGGAGGNSGLHFGYGATAGFSTFGGNTGGLYGGGGGGGSSSNNSAAAGGGAGGKGIVIITEYTRSSPAPGVSSSTDNAVARFNGTAGLLQNSAFIVDDTGHVTSFGGNITFPGTQVTSAGANTLDDYEEGSWTPTFTASGATYSYAFQQGVYTKVGNIVHVAAQINLNTSGNTLGTAQVFMSGLPFTGSGFGYAGDTVGFLNATTSFVSLRCNVNGAATTIAFSHNTAASTGNSTQTNSNNLLHATNGSIVNLAQTYMV